MDHQYRESGERNIYSSYNQMKAYVECSPNQSNKLYLIGLSIDLPQVYFQTPTNKREPKPQQNPSEERRRGGEIDLLGSLSHEYY